MFGFKIVPADEKPKSKRKKHFADKIVYISMAAIIAYTVAAFALQFFKVMEVSTTLTTCWYSFWTGEIIVLATIKNTKTKHIKKDAEDAVDIIPQHSSANRGV